MKTRRSFFQHAAGAGALSALGDLGFLSQLPAVSAQEATLERHRVRFHPDIEPLVRFIEETPQDRLLEEIAAKVKHGLSYRELLTALLLAGVRSIQPRPVGFKFHAVLVINSAHLASLASPDSDRWLPIFWALNQFKTSQAANVKEGNWVMPPVNESALPPAHLARNRFVEAMDRWDEAGADVAITALARTAGRDEMFELFARYGVRDFRDLGHKAIYAANSFRTLDAIGWPDGVAEPVLRSLAYAMLDRSGKKLDLSQVDPEEKSYRTQLEALKQVNPHWLEGRLDQGATAELFRTIRTGSSEEVSALSLKLLNQGVAPQSLHDALYAGAGELVLQAPGIRSLHSLTFTNAVHYAWNRVRDDETRRLLLLQNAAFLPLYRGDHHDNGQHLDELEPLEPAAKGDEAVAEIFAERRPNLLEAARKILAYLKTDPEGKPLAAAARRLVFLKGTDSHDYKFSSAVLEDFPRLTSPWRDRLVAASIFQLRGSTEKDTDLVKRIRDALAA